LSLAYTEERDANNRNSGKKFRLHAKDISIYNKSMAVGPLTFRLRNGTVALLTLPRILLED